MEIIFDDHDLEPMGAEYTEQPAAVKPLSDSPKKPASVREVYEAPLKEHVQTLEDAMGMPTPKPSRETSSSRVQRARTPLSVTAKAIQALSYRDLSKAQLRKKLLATSFEEPLTTEKLEQTIHKLESLGYLDDQRYARNQARTMARRMGNRKIAYQLKQKGLNSADIDEVLDELKDSEFERAYQVWLKKFGQLPEDRAQKDKQIRFLMNRGFSLSCIYQILRGQVIDET